MKNTQKKKGYKYQGISRLYLKLSYLTLHKDVILNLKCLSQTALKLYHDGDCDSLRIWTTFKRMIMTEKKDMRTLQNWQHMIIKQRKKNSTHTHTSEKGGWKRRQEMNIL